MRGLAESDPCESSYRWAKTGAPLTQKGPLPVSRGSLADLCNSGISRPEENSWFEVFIDAITSCYITIYLPATVMKLSHLVGTY